MFFLIFSISAPFFPITNPGLEVCIETVESGKMTKDLAVLIHGKKTDSSHYLTTQQFLSELKKNLESKIG